MPLVQIAPSPAPDACMKNDCMLAQREWNHKPLFVHISATTPPTPPVPTGMYPTEQHRLATWQIYNSELLHI